MDANAKRFSEIYQLNIHREGSAELWEWLVKSDFFLAPASTKYHLSREGGLCEHSLHVYDRLCKLVTAEGQPIQTDYPPILPLPPLNTPFSGVSSETLAICGLLHDICKVNFYKTEMRNTKDENGRWVQVPYYTIDDSLPYGHGEKSVYIISGFMKLIREEAMAIRWHMGFSDNSADSHALSAAFEQYPLAFMLHLADMQAAYLDERKCGE
jgi:hypothetical protein